MTARRVLLAVSIASSLVLVGCQAVDKLRGKESAPQIDEEERDSPAKKITPVGPLQPTSKLVTRPELQKLVDGLAAASGVESSHVGAAGAPSAAYASFEAVKKAATEDEMVALLHHESPVVRGYMAQHLAATKRAAELAHLVDDDAKVKTLDGCMAGDRAVSGIVREALCWSAAPEAASFLEKMAADEPAERAYVASCIARTDPARAGRMALAEVKRGAKDLTAHVRVLSAAPLAEACAPLLGLVDSRDDDLRAAVASAVAKCDSAEAFAALTTLATDPKDAVSRPAKTGLALHPRQTTAGREKLLADTRVATFVMSDLAGRLKGDPATYLPVFEELAVAHPKQATSAMNGFTGSVDDAATVATMRRVAAKVPPAASMMDLSVRTQVIAFLAKKKDPADLPELRRSLESANASELIDAITALGEMRDTASRTAIQARSNSTNAMVVRAVEIALAKL